MAKKKIKDLTKGEVKLNDTIALKKEELLELIKYHEEEIAKLKLKIETLEDVLA